MEKYKKLIEKQRELINLLDEAVDDMTELGYETREILFGEINNIEKEIEELESKFIGEQTITGDFSSVSFQQKEVKSAEEILNKFQKYFNSEDYGSIEAWIIEDFIRDELS